jgi:hypothetical protein
MMYGHLSSSWEAGDVVAAVGGVEALSALLQRVQANSIRAVMAHIAAISSLSNLAFRNDEATKAQIRQHALPALVDAVAHDNKLLQAAAMDALVNLGTMGPASCTAFLAQPRLLSLLVQRARDLSQLGHEPRYHAIHVLGLLVGHSSGREALLGCPGAVAALVQALGSCRVPHIQALVAAYALHMLAQGSAVGGGAVLDAGAVAALVQQLRSQAAGDVELRVRSSAALLELLCQEGCWRRASAACLAAGAIQPLQLLLLGALPGSRAAGSSEAHCAAALHAAESLHRIVFSGGPARRRRRA